MDSLDCCGKIKEELESLLLDGDNLAFTEDVKHVFEYISNLENPSDVLNHINDFKSEGNVSFRNGDINGA